MQCCQNLQDQWMQRSKRSLLDHRCWRYIISCKWPMWRLAVHRVKILLSEKYKVDSVTPAAFRCFRMRRHGILANCWLSFIMSSISKQYGCGSQPCNLGEHPVNSQTSICRDVHPPIFAYKWLRPMAHNHITHILFLTIHHIFVPWLQFRIFKWMVCLSGLIRRVIEGRVATVAMTAPPRKPMDYFRQLDQDSDGRLTLDETWIRIQCGRGSSAPVHDCYFHCWMLEAIVDLARPIQIFLTTRIQPRSIVLDWCLNNCDIFV